MNVMYSLTWRQMKLQRRRTVITILGVIVSVAMIAAVSSFAATFMDVFQRVEMESSGAWHALIENAGPEGQKLLAAEPEVEDLFTIFQSDREMLTTKMGRYTALEGLSLNETGRRVMNVTLVSGSYPEKEGEAAIDAAFFQGAGFQLGDTFRTLDASGEEKTYTITGAARMNTLMGYESGVGYALLPWAEENAMQENAAVYLRVKHPGGDMRSWLQALCERIPGQQDYMLHTALLAYMGIFPNDVLSRALYSMEAIIMIIILLAAVSLIYNAFAISVTDRSAQFGMLSSVGATPKQRRRAVLFEAMAIVCIAIPFGLFFGYLGIGITFRIVSHLIQELASQSTQAQLRLVVRPTAVALSVGLALITVLISAWIPARRASRVSPMEAIRQSQDFRLTGKNVKTSPLTRIFFGFEGEMAAKNLKRNRKRYRITTLSLAMSLILFLSACSFTRYMTASFGMVQDTDDYNLEFYTHIWEMPRSGVMNYQTLDQIEQKALSVSCVDTAVSYTHPSGGFSASLPEEAAAEYPYTRQMLEWWEKERGGRIDLPLVFLAMDADSLTQYAQRIGADADALMNPDRPAAILINGGNLYQNSRFTPFTVLDIQKGDALAARLAYSPLDEEMEADSSKESSQMVSFFLAGVTQQYPMGQTDRIAQPVLTLIVSQATFRALCPAVQADLQILFQSAVPDQAEEALQAIRDEYSTRGVGMEQGEIDAMVEEGAYLWVNLQNYESQRRTAQRLVTIVNIFVYGFITLLSLVGAANIVGTISTSLMLRKREFAMVKSVGMGPKQFDRMIRCESIFYGIKAVALGLVGSVIAISFMWNAMRNEFSLPFTLPWPQIALGIAAIFLLVAVTMAYSIHKIRRNSIVEDLRLE